MRVFVFALLLLTGNLFSHAQDFKGQWNGGFDAEGSLPGDRTEYSLEIETNGDSYEGTSTTYFMIENKRYYTICAIKVTVDKRSKTLIATEYKRIKANTPDWFRDCFQIHKLTYFKKGDTEELSGTWKSARAEDNCGRGNTVLSRKRLVKNTMTSNPPVAGKKNETKPSNKPVTTIPPVTQPKKNTPTKPSIPKDSVPTPGPEVVATAPVIEKKPAEAPIKLQAPPPPAELNKRENKIYDRISITEEEITIKLYDNAEVDGDIITVLFNGEVILSKQTLSDQPIVLKVNAIPGKDNVLTMFAENLGRIPPNTAIMRVQNGTDYYKVLLSADNQQNASVVFRLK